MCPPCWPKLPRQHSISAQRQGCCTGYGRQLQEDLAHHRMMEAPEDRRALSEVLQIAEIRQRLLAEGGPCFQ